MSFDPKQFIEQIIQPTLKALNLYSLAAEQLLAGTCAQESAFGTYLVQKDGPALGPWQMEPATHDSIHADFLRYRDTLRRLIFTVSGMEQRNIGVIPDSRIMLTNLAYACCMARIKYLWEPTALPKVNDIPGMAAYWKKCYNTHLGDGKTEEFINNFKRYLGDYYKDARY